MNKIEYTEISKAKIGDNKNVVISSCSKGGFTIAQQLKMLNDDQPTSVFLKGAIHVKDIDGLYELRDAINFVINEQSEEKEEDWDD